jgi:hypothetical protein
VLAFVEKVELFCVSYQSVTPLKFEEEVEIGFE